MSHRSQLEKYPGAELLPGYRLIKLLGRGGFGEVWKCEAPGRLHKAIKFVPGGSDHFRLELAAFEQVRTIRHPYLLSLERVELIEGELVMVMELADGQIHDRFTECRAEGMPGIPRAELLGYLKEAAEALDMMSTRYGLQHLDVKPENLFLVAGHLKVGDYGLVRSRLRMKATADDPMGFTPRYAAPEVLGGGFDTRSDQYSLALVYAELLTGHFPYSGKTSDALLQQHVSSPPDLSALPRPDRGPVAKAMSKNPLDRYPTCQRFVSELAMIADDPANWDTPFPSKHALTNVTVAGRIELVGNETVSNRADVPSVPEPPVSPPAEAEVHTPPPAIVPQRTRVDRRVRARAEANEPKPPPLRPILSLDELNGLSEQAARPVAINRSDLIEELVRTAALQLPGIQSLSTLPEGAESCWFISTIPSSLFPLKLAMVVDRYRLTLDHQDPARIVLTWRPAPPPPAGRHAAKGPPPPPRCGLEIVIHRPISPSADYFAVGYPTGAPATPDVTEAIPAILEQIRSALQNVEERRKFPRFPTQFPVRVYPHYSDGMFGQPIHGNCRDVSEDGVRFVTPEPVRTERAYLVFQEPASIAEAAILVHVLRSTPDAGLPATVTVARFRAE